MIWVSFARDKAPTDLFPILGLGASPSLDETAQIARLIFNEGKHEGKQLLSRDKIREALGRTGWRGYPAWSGLHYRHSFWSREVSTSECRVRVSFMEGLGDNRVIFFPSGIISFQFTDEFDRNIKLWVRAVEQVRSSCS
ncbi:MAG: hypothetical protein RhofKO_34970 [Rhodothermales bacterium]